MRAVKAERRLRQSEDRLRAEVERLLSALRAALTRYRRATGSDPQRVPLAVLLAELTAQVSGEIDSTTGPSSVEPQRRRVSVLTQQVEALRLAAARLDGVEAPAAR